MRQSTDIKRLIYPCFGQNASHRQLYPSVPDILCIFLLTMDSCFFR